MERGKVIMDTKRIEEIIEKKKNEIIVSVSFALFITASWGVYEHFYQKKMAELRMEESKEK